MNGRLRKFGLAGLLVGGTLLFGVGFAGAQSPSGDPAPVPKVHHLELDPTSYSSSDGVVGCGGHITAGELASTDL